MTLPLALNQCGSLLYMRTLGLVDMTLLVPLVNGLTFVVTLLVGHSLGERMNKGAVVGSSMVVLGITLCVIAKIT